MIISSDIIDYKIIIKFMIVNDYLMQLLIFYLESYTKCKLAIRISNLPRNNHFLIISVDNNSVAKKDIITLLNLIYDKLKNELTWLYPIYKSENDIIVLKTISNLQDKYISLDDIILKNVVISVSCNNIHENKMFIIALRTNHIYHIKWETFIDDKNTLLEDIKQIKKLNCHYETDINFKVCLTEFRLNNLIHNNQTNLKMYNILGNCIWQLNNNIITKNNELVICNDFVKYLINSINTYFSSGIVNVDDNTSFISIKLLQKYQNKVDIVKYYLSSLYYAFREIGRCLINNPEVEIYNNELVSKSNH